MDPLGLPFEIFDHRGFDRASYGDGTAIDTRGDITGTSFDGSVDDAQALVDALAASDEVARCFVRQFFQYAFGRVPRRADEAAIEGFSQRFIESGGHIKSLIRDIALSDWFSRVHPAEEVSP